MLLFSDSLAWFSSLELVLINELDHLFCVSLELADFTHIRDPRVDPGEHPLEALDSREHQARRDLVVEDDIHDGWLADGNQELPVFKHGVDSEQYVSEEGLLRRFYLLSRVLRVAERLRAHNHFDQLLDARPEHCREPIQVLVNFRRVLLRAVRLEFGLRAGQVVREYACAANELAVTVDYHWDRASRVLFQVAGFLMLPFKDVDFFELIVNAGDIEQGQTRAGVAVEMVAEHFERLLLFSLWLHVALL